MGLFYYKNSFYLFTIIMIVLNRGATQNVILTLTEKQLLTDPNYLFAFTNRSSNVQVKFVKLNGTDTSLFKDRYNKFQFIVDTLFPGALSGDWIYNVYEQVSNVNTDPSGLNLLETGWMKLKDPTQVFTQNDTSNEYFIPND